jgi:hypothetical protein
MPLVALHRLVHCGIALASGVLGRAGRRDDRRVHDGATADSEAVFSQMCVDFFEQRRAQTIAFEQMAEVADRGLVTIAAGSRSVAFATDQSLGARLHRWGKADRRRRTIAPTVRFDPSRIKRLRFVERANRSNPEVAKDICSLRFIGLIVQNSAVLRLRSLRSLRSG